jgi:hypothetical protein
LGLRCLGAWTPARRGRLRESTVGEQAAPSGRSSASADLGGRPTHARKLCEQGSGDRGPEGAPPASPAASRRSWHPPPAPPCPVVCSRRAPPSAAAGHREWSFRHRRRRAAVVHLRRHPHHRLVRPRCTKVAKGSQIVGRPCGRRRSLPCSLSWPVCGSGPLGLHACGEAAGAGRPPATSSHGRWVHMVYCF